MLWRIRLVDQDAALSRRRPGVRTPYAPSFARWSAVGGRFASLSIIVIMNDAYAPQSSRTVEFV